MIDEVCDGAGGDCTLRGAAPSADLLLGGGGGGVVASWKWCIRPHIFACRGGRGQGPLRMGYGAMYTRRCESHAEVGGRCPGLGACCCML